MRAALASHIDEIIMSPPRADDAFVGAEILEPLPHEARCPRTRVIRGNSDGVAWELWLRTPLAEHASQIAGFWAGDADSDYARHRLLPSGEMWLMFNLGPPQRVVGADGAGPGQVYRGGMIAGLQYSPLTFESILRHPRVVTVRLLPLGALAFFDGLPLLALTNQVIDLESVLGTRSGVERLRQRLMETADLGAALDLVEEWIVTRMRAGPAAHPVTHIALESLWKHRGAIRVEALARDLGVSSRYLNALFQRQVGLSAKSLVRILRFERALDILDARGPRDLVRLAQDCGYYDQSHLNRDFRELAGLTPTEYVERVFIAPGWREIGE
jgi:AraC-like DNA-binding protein